MHTSTGSARDLPAPPATDPGELRVSILGELTAARDGTAVDLGGRRQRAVLALLILARGASVPADQLIDALWGEQPPPSAPGAFQAYVSHLRRRLEPQSTARSRGNVILSRSTGYALPLPTGAVDAWRFEQLVQESTPDTAPAGRVAALTSALALWRGPALADYADEPWAQPEAARLSELHEVARENLLAARLERGESATVVPLLEALAAQGPLREERWRLLALALYRARRQGDALAALRRARTVLATELGVDPGPALRALEADLLAQSPALEAAAPATAVLISVPRAAAAADGDLVDRDRELAELRACLTDAIAGTARMVLVEGPAGIGKSRLLAEARRLAGEHGAHILTARGSRLEKEYAFGAVRQLFEPAIIDPGSRADLLSGAAASGASVFDVEAAQPQPRADGSFAVLHGLYWLTVNLAAQRPLVLAIDDLQWCDTGSLRFLAYLVRRLEGVPVLIVGTLRTGESHDDEALLAELAHDHATVQIRPSPLSPDGVADLVRRGLGEPAADAFTDACHRTTSGNPLLVRQLIRAMQAEGVRPDSLHAVTVTEIGSRAVSSMVLMRLARLPSEAFTVARAVAVLGEGAALPAIAALAGLAEIATVTAIAALARVEVLRHEHPLGFVHPLVADAVYRDLSTGERQLQHEQAARILAASGAAAQQVAAHLLQVPHRGDPWVVEVLRQAATTAADRGAADAAAAYLRRALQEPPPAADRGEVLLELGRLGTLSDGSAALDHLRDAYDTLVDPARRAAAATLLARTLVFAGQRGEATSFAAHAHADLPEHLVDERQGLLALSRIGGFMHGLDPAQWRHGADRQIIGAGPGARMLAAQFAWEHLIDGVGRERAVELARFAVADGVLISVDAGLMWVVAGCVLDMADEDVGTFWDDCLAYAHARGSLFSSLSAHLWRGYMQWRRGELREAHESFSTSAEQMTTWGTAIGSAYAEAFTLRALVDLGRIEQAHDYIEPLRATPRLADGRRLFSEAEAVLSMTTGDHETALAILDDLHRLPSAILNPVWRPWRTLRAEALAGLGRVPEAIDLVTAELDLARRWGAPNVIGATLRLLGDLRGDPALLQESVEVLAPTRYRLEYARSLHMLAKHSGDAGVASLLREAYQIAQRCGAQPLALAIHAELTRAGIDVPEVPAAAAILTTTQRRIAAMSADGADEHQIAQALFLTPHSVQRTLAEIRSALDVRSRLDLRRALVTEMV